MVDVTLTWEGLDEAFEQLEAECTDIVRGLTLYAWNMVLARTPQYAGRLAASWSYSLDSPVHVDRSNMVPVLPEGAEPHRRGDMGAIKIANAASASVPANFRLGDTVYFGNGADHGGGEYSQWVEDNSWYLRGVNKPGEAVKRTLDHLKLRFDSGITTSAAAMLKTVKME